MLAVTGGKGGTGKTTTTLGLARAVAAGGDDALAVDADWDLPDLGAVAGARRRVEYPGGEEAAAGSPLDAVRAPYDSGPRVLPAPERPRAHDTESLLRRVRRGAPSDARVFLDCPAGAGPDAAAPVRVADGALLVAEPCAAALRDAATAGAMARRLGTPVVGAVVTCATAVPPGVADLLGCPIVARIPRVREPAVESDRLRSACREAVETLATTEDGHGGEGAPVRNR
ncbi:hypothetical protein BRC97_01840 [Halobacteriales archaeon QS_6_71_20]|nr:MAG: hypothetical protein BRC97_01840 [Halobacteriales archaeon QS_6_71_20]